jgi:hypothetical protein
MMVQYSITAPQNARRICEWAETQRKENGLAKNNFLVKNLRINGFAH